MKHRVTIEEMKQNVERGTFDMTLQFFTLPWAVVGMADGDVRHALSSLRRGDEPLESAVERYVTGYLAFWHLALIDRSRASVCGDEAVLAAAKAKIEAYVAAHPPVAVFPRFYLVFLNQLPLGGDAHGLGDVFCV